MAAGLPRVPSNSSVERQEDDWKVRYTKRGLKGRRETSAEQILVGICSETDTMKSSLGMGISSYSFPHE